MWWIIGILAVIILGAIVSNNKRNESIEKDKKKLINAGIDPGKFIVTGMYVGGLTDLTKSFKAAKLLGTNQGFDIYTTEEDKYANGGPTVETRKVGSILNKEISNIITEDKSSSEKRLSVGNIALFGPLGLAMRKTKSHDLAFLIIKTNDGRFDGEGIFCFESAISNSKSKCFELANEAKSKMITHLKSLS